MSESRADYRAAGRAAFGHAHSDHGVAGGFFHQSVFPRGRSDHPADRRRFARVDPDRRAARDRLRAALCADAAGAGRARRHARQDAHDVRVSADRDVLDLRRRVRPHPDDPDDHTRHLRRRRRRDFSHRACLGRAGGAGRAAAGSGKPDSCRRDARQSHGLGRIRHRGRQFRLARRVPGQRRLCACSAGCGVRRFRWARPQAAGAR